MMQFDVNVSGDKLLFIVTETNKQKQKQTKKPWRLSNHKMSAVL